jgi:hypothetical protein
MKTYLRLAVLAGFVAGCSSAPVRSPEQRRELAKAAIMNWYTFSQVSALKLIDEYGPPDRIESSQLVWINKGPWEMTAVWNAEPTDGSNLGPENLEQTIAYRTTTDQRVALSAFNDKIKANAAGTELSARYSSEELNFLALNLADQVVKGMRDPADAQRFFDLTLKLGAAGRTSLYMQGLLFDGRTP